MAATVLWLILTALALANPGPSAPSETSPARGAAPHSRPPSSSSDEPAQSQPADEIPPPLQKITNCMVDTARRASSVLSAERGVAFEDGKALVYVRYEYRRDDGRIGLALFSRGRDAPLASQFRAPAGQSYVLFGTILSGIAPACDVIATNERSCKRVREWDRNLPQPIPGAGIDAVKSAWQQTCGVLTLAITA